MKTVIVKARIMFFKPLDSMQRSKSGPMPFLLSLRMSKDMPLVYVSCFPFFVPFSSPLQNSPPKAAPSLGADESIFSWYTTIFSCRAHVAVLKPLTHNPFVSYFFCVTLPTIAFLLTQRAAWHLSPTLFLFLSLFQYRASTTSSKAEKRKYVISPSHLTNNSSHTDH